MLNMVKFILKIPLYIVKIIRRLSLTLALVFAFSVVMFSGVANTVSAILSTVGITTATAELVSSVVDLKKQNKNLRVELNETQKTTKKKISSLEADLKKSKVARKVELDKNIRLNKQLNKSTNANKKIRDLSKRSVARGARLLSLNAGSTAVEAGVGWIPYAGLALGASALVYETIEICGQMNDMDEIANLLGAEPADRGKFAYLCEGKDTENKEHIGLGKFHVTEIPEALVPSGAVKSMDIYISSGYQSYGTEFEVRKLKFDVREMEALDNITGNVKYFKINDIIAEYRDGYLWNDIIWYEILN